MRFIDDTRAQSVVLGTVILFGFLILALSLYQVQVVPQQNAQTEFEHFQESQNEFTILKNAISRAGQNNIEQYESFRLGTTYQNRLFAVNPSPASGSLRTSSPHDMDIGETTVQTRFLEYQNGYNELEIGQLRYDNSVIYLEAHGSGDRVIYEDQNIVRGDGKVRVTALQNEFQASGTGRETVELYPVIDPSVTDEDLDGEIDIGLPTRLDASYWDEQIPDSLWTHSDSAVDESAYPDHDDIYQLQLTVNADDLRFNTVGINSAPSDVSESLQQNIGTGSGTGGGTGDNGGNGDNGDNGDSDGGGSPTFENVEATVTGQNPQGIESIRFDWELSEPTEINLQILDVDGNVVGDTTVTPESASGNTEVAITDGSRSGGQREPRPVTVESTITETGDTCNATIQTGDGDGPFALCG